MNYRKVTLSLLAAWFAAALVISGSHLLQNPANVIGARVGIAALVPVVIFALWYAASKEFREFALSINPQILTAAQTWRIMGFVFVLLEAHNLLPSVFALPAGYGDMAIGATASLVAWKLATHAHRGSFLLWQALGITDLVVAVSLGTTAQWLQPAGPSNVLMTVLPLSMIPIFLVPLFLIFHVITIAQARKWDASAGRARQGQARLQSVAV